MKESDMEKKKFLECGRIINTHGVKGAVKLESWCNTPEDLADLERVFISLPGGMKEFKIEKASVFKQFVIAELEGICEFDIALSFKNKTVYAAREDFVLDEGDYFIADIIGLPVIDVNDGKIYGKLKDVINRGASDIYVIHTESGERMMPVVEEFVKNVDLEKGIFVAPIEGMFD
jgi:16S rRNA processing protein RimM